MIAMLVIYMLYGIIVRRYEMVIADEQENSVMRWQVDAFAYDGNELSECDIFENEVLMFIDVRTGGIEVIFFADDRYFVVMFEHNGIRIVQSL
jgi:hypothetical protein